MSSAVKLPSNGLVQSNNGGAVEIDVRWRGERDGMLLFDVAMDTHSVDLDQYDLSQMAVLRDDSGTEERPAYWRSAPGGHHRTGTLAFMVLPSVMAGEARYVEMVIRNVSGVEERVLRWTLEGAGR